MTTLSHLILESLFFRLNRQIIQDDEQFQAEAVVILPPIFQNWTYYQSAVYRKMDYIGPLKYCSLSDVKQVTKLEHTLSTYSNVS